MLKSTLTLTIALACIMMFADGVQPNGSGTYSDPYLMESLDNLLWLSTTPEAWETSIHYLQTCDIDASDTENWNDGSGFMPIGMYDYTSLFSSFYDGGNHEISGLFINRPETPGQALFQSASDASISNLRVTDASITGNNDTAGFVGSWCGDGAITNCSFTGEVTGMEHVGGLIGYIDDNDLYVCGCFAHGTVTGDCQTGGLIGTTWGETVISDCHFEGIVTGNRITAGLVAYASHDRSISHSYVKGTIYFSYKIVGGLVGELQSPVDYCYADCDIIATNEECSFAGGLIGIMQSDLAVVSNSYAKGSVECDDNCGGLVARLNCGFLSSSYYNYEQMTINGEHVTGTGAVPADLFNDWVDSGYNLDIDLYLEQDEEDNYRIDDVQDLEKLMLFGQYPAVFYRLTSDIDLENTPNLYISYFAGNFNGDGHTIRNFTLDSPQQSSLGFFGSTRNATIRNLHLESILIRGQSYTGGLTGSGGFSSFESCSVNGSIECIDSGCGGVIGWMNESDVSYCFFTGDINGYYLVGGIAGATTWCDSINACFADATITCTNDYCGGIVGSLSHSTASNSYLSPGSVVNGANENTGGIAAGNAYGSLISNCYVAGELHPNTSSGIVADNGEDDSHYGISSVQNCVWDTLASGVTIGIGINEGDTLNVLGLSTDEMMGLYTYRNLGWDFVHFTADGTDDYWDIFTDWNDGYPYIHDIWVYVDNDEEPTAPAVSETALHNAYPNPFNPTTTISYSLKEPGPIEISVYNIKGQKVKVLVDEYVSAGNHGIAWDGTDKQGRPVSSGVYFYRMSTPDRTLVKKMTMVK